MKLNQYPSGLTDGGAPGATDGQSDGFFRIVSLAGDTNGNGQVGVDDLNNVRNNFGGIGLGDTNGNGSVGVEDLNAVRNNFGNSSAFHLAAVPEPGGLQLFTTTLVLFGLFGWRGRNRLINSGK